MGRRSIHLDIEVRRQVALDYDAERPKCIFFAQKLTQAKEWKAHTLDVANCWVAPYVSAEYASHLLFYFFCVKGVRRESPSQIFVYLPEILIRILLPSPRPVRLTESRVVVLDVILLVRLYPEALMPKAGP